MALFNNWPYVDEHNLNLDWVIKTLKELTKEWAQYHATWEEWKKDTDAAYQSLHDYVMDYFTDLDISTEISNKIDSMVESGEFDELIVQALSTYFDNEVDVIYHNYAFTGDTSYIVVKLPKSEYSLTFHNCSGDDTDSPTTLISNPYDYLKNHLEAALTTNCNFGGLDYPGRLNGVDYDGTVFTRRLFCYNSTDGSINITSEGATIDDVPAEYDTVFAVGDILASNGGSMIFPETGQTEPRTVFGWNNTQYIILICEGRGNGERGLTLTECKNIMLQMGALEVVNFDGGGSTCLAVNTGDNAKKINKYRDLDVEYPGLRKVGLCAVYTRR